MRRHIQNGPLLSWRLLSVIFDKESSPLYIESRTVVLTWTSLLADRLLLRQLYMPKVKQPLPKLESGWFGAKYMPCASGRWWTPDGVSSIFGGIFHSARNCTSFPVYIAMQNYSWLTKTDFASSEVEIREVQPTLKHDTPHCSPTIPGIAHQDRPFEYV